MIIHPAPRREIDVGRGLAVFGQGDEQHVPPDHLLTGQPAHVGIILVVIHQRRLDRFPVQIGAVRQRIQVRAEGVALADVGQVAVEIADLRRGGFVHVGQVVGVRAARNIQHDPVGEPDGIHVVHVRARIDPVAHEAADVRAVVVDAGQRHVKLRAEMRRQAVQVRADVAGPHRRAVTLDARRAGARQQEQAVVYLVPRIAARDAGRPQQVVDVVHVRFAVQVLIGKAVVPRLGIVIVRLSQVGPMADHALLDQMLPPQVVPRIGSGGIGPVHHAAGAPPFHQVDRIAAGFALGDQDMLLVQRVIVGQRAVDVGFLDHHQPDAVFRAQLGDEARRIGKFGGVPGQRSHVALRADVAEPLHVQHEAVHREVIVFQRLEHAQQFVPVVVAVFRHPQPEHLLGRHGRASHQFHVILAQIGQIWPGHDVPAQRFAGRVQLPRIGLEIPLLGVDVVREQGVILGALAERVIHRELGIARAAPDQRGHGVAEVAGHAPPPDPVDRGQAFGRKLLAQPVDVGEAFRGQRETLRIAWAHRRQLQVGIARRIGDGGAQAGGVHLDPHSRRFKRTRAVVADLARSGIVGFVDHRRDLDRAVRRFRRRKLEVDQVVVQHFDHQPAPVGGIRGPVDAALRPRWGRSVQRQQPDHDQDDQ